MPIYGFDPSDSPKEAYDSFIDALKQYDANGNHQAIQEFFKLNKNKQFDEVKILGVMLTGQT